MSGLEGTCSPSGEHTMDPYERRGVAVGFSAHGTSEFGRRRRTGDKTSLTRHTVGGNVQFVQFTSQVGHLCKESSVLACACIYCLEAKEGQHGGMGQPSELRGKTPQLMATLGMQCQLCNTQTSFMRPLEWGTTYQALHKEERTKARITLCDEIRRRNTNKHIKSETESTVHSDGHILRTLQLAQYQDNAGPPPNRSQSSTQRW
mmetsp:Transcript_25233/g.45603  ORF Transcript_25233/g.45603 Transcript_25233/m.45603 type:complete len:204 (-) Transcript_25233:1097-1708(-)